MVERRPLAASEEPYDASDPKAIKKAQEAVAQRDEERRQVAAAVLGSMQGREWLYQLLRDTGLFKDLTITPSEYANGYSNGRRDVGFSLMRALGRADPVNFAALLVENDKNG